jgi:hypothetical protein
MWPSIRCVGTGCRRSGSSLCSAANANLFNPSVRRVRASRRAAIQARSRSPNGRSVASTKADSLCFRTRRPLGRVCRRRRSRRHQRRAAQDEGTPPAPDRRTARQRPSRNLLTYGLITPAVCGISERARKQTLRKHPLIAAVRLVVRGPVMNGGSHSEENVRRPLTSSVWSSVRSS